MADPILCISFGAKSTEDVRDSVPRQHKEIAEEIARLGGRELVAEYSDPRVSGYRRSRGPGLQRALDHAEQLAREGHSVELWVKASDRLARGDGRTAKHLVHYILWALESDVKLRSIADDRDLSDLLYGTLKGIRNNEDSKLKGAHTRSGKRDRFEARDSTGPLQFAYRLVNKTDEDGRIVTKGDRIIKERVPDHAEVPAALHAFKMLDDGHKIGEITRWLNGQGVRTKRGNPFGRTRVREMLDNPWYGGKVRARRKKPASPEELEGAGTWERNHPEWELRDGNHEPLMPWGEFERISAKLARPERRSATRPSEVALLSGLARCGLCGQGIWHRRGGKRRRYMCSHRRHATDACKHGPIFDAERAEEAIVRHLDTLFIDLAGWIENVTAQRASERDGLVRELAALHDQRATLSRDEELVRADYLRRLRAGNERAADLATTELDRIAREQTDVDTAVGDLDARLAEWDDPATADDVLDWWNELSAAVRGKVVNGESVKEANTALRERFAAIYVTPTDDDDSVRLDFVLRERDEDAPLVSSRVWVDETTPDDGTLIDFMHDGPAPKPITVPGETGRSTFVYDHPVISQISA
jgi:site-specific DNA recombinase